jgi:hypothetical protein
VSNNDGPRKIRFSNTITRLYAVFGCGCGAWALFVGMPTLVAGMGFFALTLFGVLAGADREETGRVLEQEFKRVTGRE